MSRMALNIAHFKKGAVGALGGHNWYKRGAHDEHSNQDIDPKRSKDNIPLVLPEEGTFYRDVKSAVEQSAGRVTSASVWVSEWVLYPPEELQDPFTADRDELRRFYGDALDWMRERGYLVKLAAVHLDETTVHAHIDTIPITQDGRLSRKDVYTRAALNQIHTDLSEYLAAKGWNIRRGESTKDKQVRSVSVAEYKKQAEVEKQLTIEQIRENERILEEQREKIAEAQAWLNQIPDWPTYDRAATEAWQLLEHFRLTMQATFESRWLFRDKRAERSLLDAVCGLRDGLLASISAMRGYEARAAVPTQQQRSRAISRGLDDLVRQAEKIHADNRERRQLGGRSKSDDHER